MLQRSRALECAETRAFGYSLTGFVDASTEPRTRVRGDAEAGDEAALSKLASTEPRTRVRGDFCKS